MIFEIEVTGIGVHEEARTRIFEPFSQADASTTREHGGTGLGLLISKQLVELMGGNMGLGSRPEGGTIFNFQVPFSSYPRTPKPGASEFQDALPAEDGNPSGTLTSAMGISGRPAAAMRILAVDYPAMNRKDLDFFLTTYGTSADMATGAEEALKACERGSYHLVLMDCNMPGMDGPLVKPIMENKLGTVIENCADRRFPPT